MAKSKPTKKKPKKTVAQTLGQLLKIRRLQLELGQTELARSSKISQSRVSKMENGICLQSFIEMNALLASLGIEVHYFEKNGTIRNNGMRSKLLKIANALPKRLA